MADKLKVAYDDLQGAATAMSTAATAVTNALDALVADGKLDSDAFGHKGDKFADWYAKNLTAAQSAFRQSSHSFTEIQKGLQRAAGAYALVDALEGKNAVNGGK